MSTKSSTISSTQLPDPRDTDLGKVQLFWEIAQGGWDVEKGHRRQIDYLREALMQAEAENLRLKEVQTEREKELSFSSIVPNGQRKALIAILNAVYELFFKKTCTKTEFFRRMAIAFGDTGLADYAIQLSQIQQSQKYESIFTDLENAAIAYRTECDNA